jgi:hypothetical protein
VLELTYELNLPPRPAAQAQPMSRDKWFEDTQN